ncbi:MAG: polyprenyl synthetase family protein [Muribaculaceae bacterium]|nr:polyprenyl synthetase family protein [Muribaculaceae bacterium]
MLTKTEYAGIVEEEIRHMHLPAEPAGLYEPIRYALDCGGKRLRPVLTLAACQAFGKEPEAAINQAVGVEMFHNFTLLHDDVMDKADMRRGRPTVHVQWDERTAILSGDAMLTLAGRMVTRGCSDAELRAVLELFDRTAMEVYEGQQYDMDFEQRTDVTVEEYMDMIRLKTSVLLGCACELGAIMGGAGEGARKALYDYGVQLGLAFQLQDDYLDTYGDPMVFGKEIGGDIANDKKTWFNIMALKEDITGTVKDEVRNPSDADVKFARVKAVYDALGLPERCDRLISGYLDNAIVALDGAGLFPAAKNFFVAIAMESRNRTY